MYVNNSQNLYPINEVYASKPLRNETSSLSDFSTGSTDVESLTISDTEHRLVVEYTSLFRGHILSSSVIDGVDYLFTSGNILHKL